MKDENEEQEADKPNLPDPNVYLGTVQGPLDRYVRKQGTLVFFAILVALLVVALAVTRCTTVTTLVTSSDGTTGVEVPASAVRSCTLSPSFVRMTNGEETRVQVRTFSGDIEVLAPFTKAIEGEPLIQILADTPSSEANREIILRARGVGDTTLVVQSGSARCSAAITVLPASP